MALIDIKVPDIGDFDAVGVTVEPSFLDPDPAIRHRMAVGKK